jgi:hypothetical protein
MLRDRGRAALQCGRKRLVMMGGEVTMRCPMREIWIWWNDREHRGKSTLERMQRGRVGTDNAGEAGSQWQGLEAFLRLIRPSQVLAWKRMNEKRGGLRPVTPLLRQWDWWPETLRHVVARNRTRAGHLSLLRLLCALAIPHSAQSTAQTPLRQRHPPSTSLQVGALDCSLHATGIGGPCMHASPSRLPRPQVARQSADEQLVTSDSCRAANQDFAPPSA